jgi:hypothetical protein
VLDF